MGIWRDGSTGDDINAVDVYKPLGLVITADDYGTLQCFQYPCIVKHAPSIPGRGHSSHVMNVRWCRENIVTVGGNDNSVIIWNIKPNKVNY